jgi:hypothetical protein
MPIMSLVILVPFTQHLYVPPIHKKLEHQDSNPSSTLHVSTTTLSIVTQSKINFLKPK